LEFAASDHEQVFVLQMLRGLQELQLVLVLRGLQELQLVQPVQVFVLQVVLQLVRVLQL
jgi:hypothetical protein